MEATDDRTATERVCSSPELLESIFLQLPPQEILLVPQGVCKLWHDIVKNSRDIQRGLFFRPISSTSCRLHVINSRKFPYDELCHVFRATGEKDGRRRKVFMHPLCMEILREEWPWNPSDLREEEAGDEGRRWREMRERLEYPQASWRRMGVSQSFVREMVVEFEDRQREFGGWSAQEMGEFPGGVSTRGSSLDDDSGNDDRIWVTLGDVLQMMGGVGWRLDDFGPGNGYDIEEEEWMHDFDWGQYWASWPLAVSLRIMVDGNFGIGENDEVWKYNRHRGRPD